jgi:dephospho-CoA kinase
VGLTGGIGAGKSTALSMFAEQGAITTSADAIVHALYRSPEFIGMLAERFGDEVLGDDGHIDRRAVAAKVKASLDDLRRLEELTHPLVRDEIRRVVAVAPTGAVVVAEVPLMFEADFQGLFDLLVTVEAGQDNRMTRSAHRFDPVVFAEFEGLQATSDERVAGSDMAYWNDGSFDHMRTFVQEAYEQARALLAQRPAAGGALGGAAAGGDPATGPAVNGAEERS